MGDHDQTVTTTAKSVDKGVGHQPRPKTAKIERAEARAAIVVTYSELVKAVTELAGGAGCLL